MEKSDPLPLSVVIVARNEESVLPRCLASVRNLAAEIVVALNATTDRSADVAQAVGARVAELPWTGFRDTKNAALALATQPWILCLDADEEVSPALEAELRRFLGGSGAIQFAGARFPRKVHFLGRWITHGDWYPDYSLRLLRAGRGRWSGDPWVHEKITCDGAVMTMRGDLHHYSFPTLASHVGKMMPFAELFLQQQRGQSSRFSVGGALVRPFWRFFRGYFVKRGFLDGFPGWYIAWGTAFGALVRHTRLYEEEQRERTTAQI